MDHLISSCSDAPAWKRRPSFLSIPLRPSLFLEQSTAFARFESGPDPWRNKTGRAIEAEPERACGAGKRPHQTTRRQQGEAPALSLVWACLGEENQERRMVRCPPDVEDAPKCLWNAAGFR